MTTYEESPATIPYRLRLLESFQKTIEGWRREVDEDRNTLKYMASELKTIKRVAVALLISFVTGSASVTIAIILSTKHV